MYDKTEKIIYRVPLDTYNISVRAFLRQKGVSGSRFRSIKNNGSFWLNGKLIHAEHTMLQAGDIIAYEMPCLVQNIIPEKLPLDIRYEDEDLLIVNKLAGMLVHPVAGHMRGTLANAVLGYYRERGWPLAFHAVHRLDRLTSGLVLIAKRPEIQHLLSTKDEQGVKKVRREYLAVANGVLEPPFGTIDVPLARSPASIITRVASPTGQKAITHYRTLQVFFTPDGRDAYSLLTVSLVTGRTHQIRAHLSHIGHPLLGDDLYGGSRKFIDRQALHAARLQLRHPLTDTEIDIEAELPDDMQKLIAMT